MINYFGDTDDNGKSENGEEEENGKQKLKNKPPVATIFVEKDTIYQNETLTFDASDSYDPDGHITQYKWDFGDSSYSNIVKPSHKFTKSGQFIVKLMVRDNNSAYHNDSITIIVFKVENKLPVPIIIVSKKEIYQGEDIDFDAKDSYDPDGYIKSYKWEIGDGTYTLMMFNLVFDIPGQYNVKLTVTDNNNTYSDTTIQIIVKKVVNKIPVAVFIISKTDFYQGENISFDASGSYDPDGTIKSYTWQIGTNTYTQKTFILSFDVIGTYTVKLIVTDNNNSNGENVTSINVSKAISMEMKINEYRVGWLSNYYYVQLTMTNKGEKQLKLEWDTTYFWLSLENNTKYAGSFYDSGDKTISAYSTKELELRFDDFPKGIEPYRLIFEYDLNYNETVDF